MVKRIIIIVISLIAIILSYIFYCDYYWERFYEEHQYWGREENIETYEFSVSTDKEDLTDNFTQYEWHRILVEPEHGMWINEVTLSFPDDTTLTVKVDPHYFIDNWWTYPLTRKFLYDRETYYDNYYFSKDEMIFVRKFEPYQIDDSLYTTPSDTVHLDLNGNKLAIKHVFL